MLGANVQEDQLVTVGASLGQEEMAREVAAAAYRRGARFVDVTYFDAYTKRARIEHARAETLDFVPGWFGDRMLELGRQRAARISLSGPAPPDALAGLDPDRAGRDQLPFIKEVLTVINERLVNWTVVPAPTLDWALLVYPELAGPEALERLWAEIGHVCRLDEPDPVAAWAARGKELDDVARRLEGAGLDALHFEGPGTDLVVGLFPDAAVGNRGRRDGGRHPAHGEPPLGGGVHVARPRPHRGRRLLDEAARAVRRADRQGARRALRARPRRRDHRRRGW